MDNRILRNKKALRDALIDNCNGDAYSMSVSSLCKIANVSRAAFYNYYEGIHSIIEEIEEEFLAPLLNANSSMSLPGTLKTAETFLKHKREWIFLLRNGRARTLMLNEVKQFVRENMVKHNCRIAPELFDFYVQGASQSLLNISIYLMEGTDLLSAEMLAKVFETIEQSTYDMLDKIGQLH